MDWFSAQCLLCLETRDKYTSINDSALNQFYTITSAVLTPPIISDDERGVCRQCYNSVKSTVDFVNKITEAKQYWGMSNNSNFRKLEINSSTTSSSTRTTNSIISKLQKSGKICIKKISNSNSEPHVKKEPLEPIVTIKEELDLDIPADTDPFEDEETMDDMIDQEQDQDYEDGDSEDDDDDDDYQPEEEETTSKIRNYTKKVQVQEIVLEAPTAYTCRKCQNSWPTISELHEHMKTSSCFKSDLTCKVCDREFETRRKFVKHIATHKPKETFMCEECSKIFMNKFSLETHLQSVHGRIRLSGAIFTCNHCYDKFNSHAELAEHMQEHLRHKKEAERLCEDCGKKCANLKAYRTHIRTHTEKTKRFKCKECDKSFQCNISLIQHAHVHTGVKAFQCEYCPKAYAKRESLRHHQRQHENNYPYSCDNCDNRFVSLLKLRTHLKRCVPK